MAHKEPEYKLTTSDYGAYEDFEEEHGEGAPGATFIGYTEGEKAGIGLGHEDFTADDLDAWYRTQGIVAGREPLRMHTWQDDQGVWQTTTFFDNGSEETRLATNSDARSADDRHPDWNMDGTPVIDPIRSGGSRNTFLGDDGDFYTTVTYDDGASQTFRSDQQGERIADPIIGMPSQIGGHPDYESTEEFITLKTGFLSELKRLGLDPETTTALWDWVEGRFVEDESFTAAQALIEVYDHEAFKRRFPGITEMRKEVGRRDIPTPGDYLAREKWLARKFEEYGMGALQVNLDNVVAESFMKTIGSAELEERLQEASKVIYEVPEVVKNTFADWFGRHGDAALMATFLDPNDEIFGGEWKKLVGLKGDVAAAEVGGWSRMHLGLDAPVTEERSRAIARLGWRDEDVWEGLDLLKAKEDLFAERLGEVDYKMEAEGVAAQFGIDVGGLAGTELRDLISRRAARRTADFAGGGGAILTGTTTGFGAANA